MTDRSQIPLIAKDFLLFRRDSPNLSISSTQNHFQNSSKSNNINNPDANSWIADYFLVASSSSSSIIIHICPITGQFIHKNKLGVDVFPTKQEAIEILEKNFGCVRVSGQNGFFELASMYDVIALQHLHQQQQQQQRLQLFSSTGNGLLSGSSTSAATAASIASAQQELIAQQQKIQQDLLRKGGEFTFLLGACFVKNVPPPLPNLSSATATATTAASNNAPTTIVGSPSPSNLSHHQNLGARSTASSSTVGTSVSQQLNHLHHQNSIVSQQQHHQQSNLHQGNTIISQNNHNNNNLNASSSSPSSSPPSSCPSVPMLELYLVVADELKLVPDDNENDEAKKLNDFATMAPGLRRLANVRAIKISSNLVGVLCDPQLDYTATASVHALNAREMNSAYPSISELLTTIQSYANNFCFHFEKSTSFPSFYGASDFVQIERDEEKHRAMIARAKEMNSSLQTVISSSDVAKTFVDTKAQIVPWNFGMAVPFHRAENQSLARLCVKVSLVFEFVNDLPPETPSSSTHNKNSKTKTISRIVAIPTFMYLKSSFFTLPRWNQFSCGIEVASFSFSSSSCRSKKKSNNSNNNNSVANEDAAATFFQTHFHPSTLNNSSNNNNIPPRPIDEFYSATWVCSRPLGVQQQQQGLGSGNASAASTVNNQINNHNTLGKLLVNPSSSSVDTASQVGGSGGGATPIELASSHLPEAGRRELFASVESEMKSRVQGRWTSSFSSSSTTLSKSKKENLEEEKTHDNETKKRSKSSNKKRTQDPLKRKENLLLYSRDPLTDFCGDIFGHTKKPSSVSLKPVVASLQVKTLAPGLPLGTSRFPQSWSDCLLTNLFASCKKTSNNNINPTSPNSNETNNSNIIVASKKNTSSLSQPTVLPTTNNNTTSSSSTNSARNLQLRSLIVDFCTSICKVRTAPDLIVGASPIRPLSDPPVVSIKMNKILIPSSKLSTHTSVIADMLPNSILRGVWYNNRILKNSLCVTFAVPHGTKLAGVGFLRPVFPRPSMGNSNNSSSSSSINSNASPYHIPPLRTAPFSPYPLTNRPELKYRAPFPSSAWSVTVGISTILHDENPTLLLHDVNLPLVLYSESRPATTASSNSSSNSKNHHNNKSSSTSSGAMSLNYPEHALCVLRIPELSSVESRGFLTVPNDDAGPQQFLQGSIAIPPKSNNSNNNSKKIPSPSSSLNQNVNNNNAFPDEWAIAHGLKDVVSTLSTSRCSFVSVVLRGSTNAEVPFGAHQIVLFGEIPDRSTADICILDHQTTIKMVDPISTGKALLSLPEQRQYISSAASTSSNNNNNTNNSKMRDSLLTFSTPQSLHEAFAAEEKRIALQLAATVWNSYNTIKNGNQFGKLNFNAHVCEFPISTEIAKLITIAGGNVVSINPSMNPHGSTTSSNVAAAPTNIGNRLVASTACCSRGCGKGGFFNRLTACDNCGRNFCSSHWKKLKDSRILERCSNVGVFSICNSCETLMNLLEAALAELEPKAMTVGATAISSNVASLVGDDLTNGMMIMNQEANAKWQQKLNLFQNQRRQTNNSNNNNNAIIMKPSISLTARDILFTSSSNKKISLNWSPVAKFDDECSRDKSRLILDFILPCRPQSRSRELKLGLLVHSSVKNKISSIFSSNLYTFNSNAKSASSSSSSSSSNHHHQQNHSNNNNNTTTRLNYFYPSSEEMQWIVLSPSRAFVVIKLERNEDSGNNTSRNNNNGTHQERQEQSSLSSSSSSLYLQDELSLLRITFDVVDSTSFRKYINCVFVRNLEGLSDEETDDCSSSSSKLSVSKPPRRKILNSLYDDDDDDDEEEEQESNRNNKTITTQDDATTTPATTTMMTNIAISIETPSEKAGGSSSQVSSSSPSTNNNTPTPSLMMSNNNHHNHTFSGCCYPLLSSPSIRLPLQQIQYSKDIASEMSVRNMILAPNGTKTNCRIWIRPPTSVPQPGQQVGPTHGVWGDAAGIMLRLPFGVSPSLHLHPQQQYHHSSYPVNSTGIHSFRTFVIERDITCRTHHVATLAVPLIYLVSRSSQVQNAVEVFLPFGKSIREENAAGFVLDVETVEKRDPSTGGTNAVLWERDWSALADSASPFFVRETNSATGPSTNNNSSNNNHNLGNATLTNFASSGTKQRGNAVSTVNSGDFVKNSMF